MPLASNEDHGCVRWNGRFKKEQPKAKVLELSSNNECPKLPDTTILKSSSIQSSAGNLH